MAIQKTDTYKCGKGFYHDVNTDKWLIQIVKTIDVCDVSLDSLLKELLEKSKDLIEPYISTEPKCRYGDYVVYSSISGWRKMTPMEIKQYHEYVERRSKEQEITNKKRIVALEAELNKLKGK